MSGSFDKRAFAARMLSARMKKGMTQLAVGESVGCSAHRIYEYEYARRTPPVERLAKLCALYGISADEVIFGEGCRDAPQSIFE